MARSRTLTLTVPAPRLPSVAGDLLGILGLVAIVVCVGGLVGNWWVSGVLAGVAGVFLSWVAAKNATSSGGPPAASAPAGTPAAAPLYGRGRSA